jgi:carboxyl-terminal processing protease
MKRNLKLIGLALLFSAASCSFTTKSFDDPDKDKTLIDLITYVLERGHYDAKDINDDFSENVFTDFIDALDPDRRYFYKKDIEEFSEYKTEIDDMIRNKDLTFFNVTYNRFLERQQEANKIQQDVLSKPFDFTKEEILDTEYEAQLFVKNKKALKERWRQQLKLNALSSFYDKKEDQEREPEEGEEADDEPKEILTDKELEEKAREEVADNMTEFFEFTSELERKDYFSVFLNAIVEEFDPHTTYYPPVAKDRFDQQMSGQFQGIGARLQKRNGEVRVTDIISGGPAWRGDELRAGDVILKVSQEEDEEATSIVGMRLDDAIKLIKGPKGTKVILNVKSKLDGSNRDIEITRDIVELEEVYAKSAFVDKDERNYGIINLPKFYFNMDNYNQRNAAADVAQEIERLKKENIEGLIIDLRNNGGGSLKTVVDIAGLFIKEGPIVQVKYNSDAPEILKDEDDTVLWDGPLVILVNEISASASEILAAAMQDYKRAIIIGGKQTYGKGTVQNVLDLNRYLRTNDLGDIGALKMTTQKFYRVNGGSTQLEGVKSDVVVPDQFSYVDIGERDTENPLPWDKIEAANYNVWDGYIDFEETITKSVARMEKSEQLQLIDDYAKWLKGRRDDTKWSLTYEGYKKRVTSSEEAAKRFDIMDEYDSNLEYKSLPYEEALFEKDTVLKEKRVRWHENLRKDVYVEEAINVLQDLKLTNIRKSKIAAVKD